ncbi:hypothetical protein B4N89_41485 [Embleya scabrispora]|uniref:Uncharacterized protein n=1 Tax=Embleya scabrispora TaxID=159449 RepID=A0A1T3NJM6_9ACTN|nr:hypothetical protein [Embleya scabrispora]OPC77049.1 hypothetical protein B4N89_41485 [Embleya scabrispora]
MLGITVSRALTIADVMAVFGELLPRGLRSVVRPPGADVPDDTGNLWASLEPTHDPAWPLGLVVHVYEFDLGPYPDLRLAEHIATRLGTDVLCGVDPSLADVDPWDPYYALALVDGRWHLASTAGSRLMGPYTVCDVDGVREEPGDEPVRLLRRIGVDTR